MDNLTSLMYGVDLWLLLRMAALTIAYVLWVSTLERHARTILLRGWAVVWLLVTAQVWYVTR